MNKVVCPDCGGAGGLLISRCDRCGGSGKIEAPDPATVSITHRVDWTTLPFRAPVIDIEELRKTIVAAVGWNYKVKYESSTDELGRVTVRCVVPAYAEHINITVGFKSVVEEENS
jgi:hypothetical protein